LSSIERTDIVSRFKEDLSTASISDVTGQNYAMRSYIRPLVGGVKVAGYAVTVRTEPGDASKPTEAVELAKSGDIIVIDAKGSDESACWGGNDSIGSKQKGLSGVIVDGAIRDTAEIRQMRFPTWARSATPRTGGPRRGGETNVPIECGGVRVTPGDIIMADDDGVVVIPQREAAEVLARSIQREALEKGIMRKVLDGLTLSEALRAMHPTE
jgi:RraA family protein